MRRILILGSYEYMHIYTPQILPFDIHRIFLTNICRPFLALFLGHPQPNVFILYDYTIQNYTITLFDLVSLSSWKLNLISLERNACSPGKLILTWDHDIIHGVKRDK